MKRFFLWSLTLFSFVFGAGVCSGAAGGGIRLDKAAFMIDSGDKMKIRLAEAPAGGVQWTSSDEKVATVSRSGVVTGVSKGDAVITASAAGSKAECIVSVGYEGQNPILPPTWGLFIADGRAARFRRTDVYFRVAGRDERFSAERRTGFLFDRLPCDLFRRPDPLDGRGRQHLDRQYSGGDPRKYAAAVGAGRLQKPDPKKTSITCCFAATASRCISPRGRARQGLSATSGS